MHIDNSLTADLVKKCHIADKAIQDRYGVRYLQILLNQPQGYLFCLVEGPDKESCERVHREAHGNIACNILEITETNFSALLSGTRKDGMDFTLNPDGTFDSGNRAVLVLDLVGAPESCRAARDLARPVALQFGGRHGNGPDAGMIVLFEQCSSAVDAGIAINGLLSAHRLSVESRVGIDTGPPLEKTGNFFERAFRSAGHFAFISKPGQVTLTKKVMQDYGNSIDADKSVKVISPLNEKFVHQLMHCVEEMRPSAEASIAGVAMELGVSKSQLGRRLHALTGYSPNDFIKEFRLRRAASFLQENAMNIAEVTMAIGFSNPSYFAKCFRERFGRTPSEYQGRQ